MPQSETRRSLTWCSLEGMSAAVVGACSSGAVLTAWAGTLGASPLALGVLWALPYLAQLAQPWAAWLTSVLGPKRLAVGATTVSRQALWILVLLPLLPSAAAGRAVLILALGVVAVAGVVGNNAWTSWVAVMVPSRIRGRYFGPRNAGAGARRHGRVRRRRCTSSTGGPRSALVAWAPWRGRARAVRLQGSSGQFSHELAALSRERGERGERDRKRSCEASPRDILAAFEAPDMRRILLFQAVWGASTGIAASLYTVHALTALGIGVTGLALCNTMLATSRVFATPFWGRALDRAGPRSVLVMCSMLSAFGSALWIGTSHGCPGPVAVDAIVLGVALGGIELAVFAMFWRWGR